MIRALIRVLRAADRCSYCSGEAITYIYPCGPELPMPVCGACATS
jgi:hypothetical protein